MKTIVITGEKGGVGKSTVTCLLAEWLMHRGKRVRIVDADPNETTREWVEACREEGRPVSADSADYQLVDTAGRSGSGLKFVHQADFVLAPFQPLAADVSRVVAWFMALHPRIQAKVGFIPNRLRAPVLTIEQRAGLAQIGKLIEHEGNGVMLPGLMDRLAVYPTLFDGSSTNFYEHQGNGSFGKAQAETDELFSDVWQRLGS